MFYNIFMGLQALTYITHTSLPGDYPSRSEHPLLSHHALAGPANLPIAAFLESRLYLTKNISS